ncbi:MAG: glutaminase domain-containing protein [Thermogutta sp.]
MSKVKARRLILAVVFAAVCRGEAARAEANPATRPPAVPLVVHDPYFSIWSFGDRLTDDWPRHWTGRVHALCGMVRVDGTTFQIMGRPSTDIPAMRQTGLRVLPTRTIYEFEGGGVRVGLTFFSPVLPRDLDTLSRPVTYIVWEVRSIDGLTHAVQVYFDNTAEPVVHEPQQRVVWNRGSTDGVVWMRMGTEEQPVLAVSGDDRRIDWGYLYTAVPREMPLRTVLTEADRSRETFRQEGTIPAADDEDQPRRADDRWPVAACCFDLGEIADAAASCRIMLAYDDLFSIQYFGENLRPYWRRNGWEAEDLLRAANDQYAALLERSAAFDEQLMAAAESVGGRGYANLTALAYRHAVGAHKLAVGPGGKPMLFSKECFSNGCIGTVDVLYPTSPIFMLLDNDLLKATVTPVFEYAAMPRWPFPFAPHDLGQYPLANGQVYGGREHSEENQMPVEESGNMIIVAYVIALNDGSTAYLERYWPLLTTWAEYLKVKGLDPENQLCTDDFTGHLAHNANLSLKAIVALACFGKLCEMRGLVAPAEEYLSLARTYAKQWVELADDGDHFRLAFDKPGTWSQKYNLVWDRLLGLQLFGPEVRAKEVAFYKGQLQPYGLPLDNRALFTKTDWEVWTATLADDRADFEALMQPVYRFVDETPDRIPLTDWYWTDSAKVRGFRARPVIGGVFIKMLDSPEVRKRFGAWR